MTAAFFLRYWKYGAMAILAMLLGIQTLRIGRLKHDVAAEQAAHAADVKLWQSAGELAVARARQNKAEIEGERIAVTSKVQDETSGNLAAFRDAVRVRSAAKDNHSSPGGPDLPSLSYSPSVFDQPGADTVISREDARICGENTIELIGWQDWYAAQHKIEEQAR